MEEKSFADIIRKMTGADYCEPSATAVEWFKNSFSRLFDNIGYKRNNIEPFEAIIEFMARYQLASLNHEKLESLSDTDALKDLYNQEIKGKKFRLPRGLVLCGKYGTGKTLAARIISERFDLPMIDTYSISFQYQKKDGNDWIEKWLYSNCRQAVVIDDLGAEGDVKKFGNESPIGAILATRARFWEQYGTPTIYTTNKDTLGALAQHYDNDKRLLDRFATYYIGVEFTGASLRK